MSVQELNNDDFPFFYGNASVSHHMILEGSVLASQSSKALPFLTMLLHPHFGHCFYSFRQKILQSYDFY